MVSACDVHLSVHPSVHPIIRSSIHPSISIWSSLPFFSAVARRGTMVSAAAPKSWGHGFESRLGLTFFPGEASEAGMTRGVVTP